MRPALFLRLLVLVPLLGGCARIPSRIALPAPLQGIEPLAVRGRMDGDRIGFGPFAANGRIDEAVLRRSGALPGGRGDRESPWSVSVQRAGVPLATASCRSFPSLAFDCTLLLPGGDTLGTLDVRSRSAADSATADDDAPPDLVGTVLLDDRQLRLEGRSQLRAMACLGPAVCAWLLADDRGRVLTAVEANAGGWVYPSDDLTDGEFDLVGIIGSILLLRPDIGVPGPRPATP
jgi:hypothetical protein